MPASILLVNAAAGGAERDAVTAACDVIARQGPVRTVETDHAADLDELIHELEEERLVVCGGDGSVHLAVARLDAAGRLDVPVGLVPLGTGNDLARGLDLPLGAEEAARRIVEGRPQPIDLLRSDDGRICVNALHAGIGVDAARRAEDMKDAIGPAAYPIGAIAAGVAVQGWDVMVEVDGRPLRASVGERVLMVAVMNALTFGGGTPMAPHALADDGRLEVVVVNVAGPAARAAFATALRRGAHLDRDDVASTSGSSVTIRGEAIGYNIDGELEDDELTERTWQVDPGAWRLIR